MASYDQPGFQDRTPAGPVVQSTGAPGSPSAGAVPDTDSAAGVEGGTIGSSAVVTPPGGSLVNADRVEVSPADVLVSSQALSYGPARDPLTGVGAELGQTGAGAGHTTARHPNSESRP
jgi:hypothetical protein